MRNTVLTNRNLPSQRRVAAANHLFNTEMRDLTRPHKYQMADFGYVDASWSAGPNGNRDIRVALVLVLAGSACLGLVRSGR